MVSAFWRVLYVSARAERLSAVQGGAHTSSGLIPVYFYHLASISAPVFACYFSPSPCVPMASEERQRSALASVCVWSHLGLIGDPFWSFVLETVQCDLLSCDLLI